MHFRNPLHVAKQLSIIYVSGTLGFWVPCSHSGTFKMGRFIVVHVHDPVSLYYNLKSLQESCKTSNLWPWRHSRESETKGKNRIGHFQFSFVFCVIKIKYKRKPFFSGLCGFFFFLFLPLLLCLLDKMHWKRFFFLLMIKIMAWTGSRC